MSTMGMATIRALLVKDHRKWRRLALGAVLLAAAVLVILTGHTQSALAAGNLVSNPSFEQDIDGNGIPDGWTPYDLTSADKRVCNQSYVGACSFKMQVDGTGKILYQDILVGGGVGESYKFTFWVKGKNIPSGDDQYIVIYFFHTDGSIESVYLIVPSGNFAWTKYVLNTTSDEPYDSLEIQINELTGSSGGKLWVDKMKLVRSP